MACRNLCARVGIRSTGGVAHIKKDSVIALDGRGISMTLEFIDLFAAMAVSELIQGVRKC
jgi:hypothetical protein